LLKIFSIFVLDCWKNQTHAQPNIPKKISQIAATTALGTAMLSAAVTAPADAANIKSYNISGQFASKAVTGSVGLPALLQGGSFKGSFDILPTLKSGGFPSLTT
jgi:hypothetical protein